ncbi:MAG: hypothetical protein AAGN82_13190 [Myxococcota bacterium]
MPSRKHDPASVPPSSRPRTSGLRPRAPGPGEQTGPRSGAPSHPRPLLLLRLLDERRTGHLVVRGAQGHQLLPVLRGVPLIRPGATVGQWRRWLCAPDGATGFRTADVVPGGTAAPVLAWIANGLRAPALRSHAARVTRARGETPLQLRASVPLRPLQLRAAERLVVEEIRRNAPTFAELVARPTTDPDAASHVVFILSALRYLHGEGSPVLLPPLHAPQPTVAVPCTASRETLATPNWTREQVELRHRELAHQSPAEVLGVAPLADGRTVQAAYMKQLFLWHPDRLAPSLADLRPAMTTICDALGRAFATLSDPDRPAAGARGPTPSVVAEPRRGLDADAWADRAEVFLRQGALAKAELATEKALDEESDHLRALALQAWIQAERLGRASRGGLEGSAERYAGPLRQLDRVLVRDPRFERARYYRAQLRKRSGMIDEAMSDFAIVAKLNPRNVGAERELRIHEMRRRGGRFFRRKRR